MEKWQDPGTLALWLLIVLVFIFILVLYIIRLVRSTFKRIIRTKQEEARLREEHQQELLVTSHKVEEREKKRIAAELHDHFGVNLSTLKLWIGRIPKNEEQRAVLEKVNSLIDQNIESVRDLSHQIYPPLLRELGLYTALKELANDLAGKIDILIIPARPMPQTGDWIDLQLFRICQEFIQNSLKYSQSDQVEIRFRNSETGFVMYIRDFGVGFDQHGEKAGGLGLKNMKSRGQAIGARMKMRSRIGYGTSYLLIKERL